MSSLVGNISIVILRTKSEESPYIATLRYAQSDEIGRKFTIPNYFKSDFSCTFLHTFALTLHKIALFLHLKNCWVSPNLPTQCFFRIYNFFFINFIKECCQHIISLFCDCNFLVAESWIGQNKFILI